jgi:hypothetical protein
MDEAKSAKETLCNERNLKTIISITLMSAIPLYQADEPGLYQQFAVNFGHCYFDFGR